jgi:hypothetical protein
MRFQLLKKLVQLSVLTAALALATAAVTTERAQAAFPGYNGRIAYERGGNIYTISPNGCDERLLTSGYDPAWSADGKKLAFARGGDEYTITPTGRGRSG